MIIWIGDGSTSQARIYAHQGINECGHFYMELGKAIL